MYQTFSYRLYFIYFHNPILREVLYHYPYFTDKEVRHSKVNCLASHT